MAGIEGGRQEGQGAGRVLMTSEPSPSQGGCHSWVAGVQVALSTHTREKQNLSPLILRSRRWWWIARRANQNRQRAALWIDASGTRAASGGTRIACLGLGPGHVCCEKAPFLTRTWEESASASGSKTLDCSKPPSPHASKSSLV